MIRALGSVSGITMQPSGLDVGLAGNNIKSIQFGQVTTTLATQAVTINKVDKTKCLAFCNNESGSTNPGIEKFAADLTTDTNLNLVRGVSGSSRTVNWVVIEFNNVKSLQTGIAATSAGLAQITVNGVNLAKAMLFNEFAYLASVTNITLYNSNFRIVNATTIEVNDYSNANSRNYWKLIEFN